MLRSVPRYLLFWGILFLCHPCSSPSALLVEAEDAPEILLTSPNGGNWPGGGAMDITWTSVGVDSLRIEYSLNSGADWTNLAPSVPAAMGSFAWNLPDTVSVNCLVRISDVAGIASADTSDAPFAILERNVNAAFELDADLKTPGCQDVRSLPEIGGGKLIGFALYAKAWEQARGYTVRFSWDPAKIEYRSASSALSITDDERTLNGDTFVPAVESNVMSGSLMGAGEINRSGFYTKSFALQGGPSVSADTGLLWLAVFRTAAAFSPGDTLAIRAEVIMADETGMEYHFDAHYLTIAPQLEPPADLTVTDIPDDQGHSVRLDWTLSPSEVTGMVSGYRIFRSRLAEFTDPMPLSAFADLDTLIFYEELRTVLVDSVAAGISTFTDPFVPVNGVPYHYWVQAVGPQGVSKPVPSSLRTEVDRVTEFPEEFHLGPARPNPFNPATTIEYSLPGEAMVTLTVFNVTGQKVATLVSGRMSAGKHSATWDARDFPSGVYFYTLRAGAYQVTGKALLLK